VQTTKFKDVLSFLGSNLDIDGHGTTEKGQPQRCFAKGTASLLKIRVCLSEEDELKLRSRRRLQKSRTRPLTAIRVSVTPFPGCAHYNAAAALVNERTSEWLNQQPR
jgi:hypothetical protein